MPAINSISPDQNISRSRIASLLAAVATALFVLDSTAALSAEGEPLELEAKISLGDVRGRIDHMAIDLARHRLLVAALGNDSLAVVNLEARRLDRNIGGLSEPQGVGYDPATDTVYVANAGDGSVRLFTGGDFAPADRIDLGNDADNIRIDANTARVFVGHGDGALAIIDAGNHRQIGSAPLKAHPESFQLDGKAGRIFVNVPKVRSIDVLDSVSGKRIASWSTAGRSANFAMALDRGRQRVLVAFRQPAELGVFSSADGRLISSIPTCGDVDDLFADSKRDRIYLSCGAGFIDVLAAEGDTYRRAGRVPTAAGARTALFVPELDRLLLAVPARGANAAAVWVFRPLP